MSADRDFYQLLDPFVRVLATTRPPGQRIVDAADVERRFGVRPEQWCDRLALVGDPADNIPGVRGIGTVTAARLLADGRRLEDLPNLLGTWRPARVATLVAEAYDRTLGWRDLARMRADLDVPLEPTGRPTPPLPLAARILDRLDLW